MHFLPLAFTVFGLLHGTASYAEGIRAIFRKAPLKELSCEEIANESLAKTQESFRQATDNLFQRLGLDKYNFEAREEMVFLISEFSPLFTSPKFSLRPLAQLLYAQLVTRQEVRQTLNEVIAMESKLVEESNRLLAKGDTWHSEWMKAQGLKETIAQFKATEISLDQATLEEVQPRQNLKPTFKDSLVYQSLKDLEAVRRKVLQARLEFQLRMDRDADPDLFETPDEYELYKVTTIVAARTLPQIDFTEIAGHVALLQTWSDLEAHFLWVQEEFIGTLKATKVIPTLLSPQASLDRTRKYRDELIVYASGLAKSLHDLTSYDHYLIKTADYPHLDPILLPTKASDLNYARTEHHKQLREALKSATEALAAYRRFSPQFTSSHIAGLDLWEKDMLLSFESFHGFLQAMTVLDATSQRQLDLRIKLSDALSAILKASLEKK